VDDVHFAIDAPVCPWFAVAKIDNTRVRFIKLNFEIAQDRVPEPVDIRRRSAHQFIVRAKSVFLDELPEIGLCDQFRRWTPDKFATEVKLTHVGSVRVFQLQGNGSGCRKLAGGAPALQTSRVADAKFIGRLHLVFSWLQRLLINLLITPALFDLKICHPTLCTR